jgi:peptide-methionine (S)-S-oxide reductase
MKNLMLITLVSIIVCAVTTSCQKANLNKKMKENKSMDDSSAKMDTATFGQGCFWCAEAIFERVEGVKSVVSGYAGGNVVNPSYEQVCTGTTGHAEVVQIVYDPDVVSFDELLKIFWKTHDPTTLNRQGADAGTQYRSIILYHNEQQKEKAEYYKNELDKSGAWDKPIVTQIVPFTKFYRAEDYHQDYFENNPYQGYCSFVIAPKVEKFEKAFKDKLKK